MTVDKLIGAPNFVWPYRGKYQHITDDLDKTRCGKSVYSTWSSGYLDNVSRCPKCGDFAEWELAQQTRREVELKYEMARKEKREAQKALSAARVEVQHNLMRAITEAIQGELGENVEVQLSFKPGGSSARVIIQTAKGPLVFSISGNIHDTE